ncbi:MAG: ABC transporter ATP-binding protein [Pirellulales bacterium]
MPKLNASSRPATLGGSAARSPTNWALVRRLLQLAWRYRAGCLHVLMQQLSLVLLSIGSLGFTGLGIDVIRHAVSAEGSPPEWPFNWQPPIEGTPLITVAWIAAATLATSVTHALLRYRAAVTLARLTQRIVLQLRVDVYDKLQRLTFRFFDGNSSGSIINRVAGDVQSVRMFVDGVIIQLLTVVLSLAVYLGYMLSMQAPLTLACLATTPILWLAAIHFSRSVKPAYAENSRLTDRLVLALSENIQGVQVVKGCGREADEIEKFAAANRCVKEQKWTIFRRIALFQPAMGFLTQFNMVVLLGYGGYLVSMGQLSLGTGLFVFANLLSQFANHVGQVTNIANSIQSSLTGAQRVFEILDAPVEVESGPNALRPVKLLGHVRFDRVSFGYSPGQRVLDEIDFSARPGQCVAIVGETGAGKSTLVNLLPRFYDVTAGRITIDGIDLRELDLDQLRRSVGIVFQESFLFSNTVAANIAFGHPDANAEQIERAARIAAADGFVRDLPQGYDTVVGEYGSNLSGGQRQRLAIARAVLLEPPILIFDDALAAVDPETEYEILAAMESAMRGRTTFVIAHRLSTLRRADLVLVLDHGRIVQRGTHEELMRQSGHYRRSALLQAATTETEPAIVRRVA